MHGTLSIDETTLPEGVLLTVAGEVDVSSVHELIEALAQADHGPPAEVWIDLSGVGFMDSTGLATLVLAHRRMDNPVRRLGLICPAGPVRRVLEIAGIDRVVPVHASLDTAQALS